MTASDHISTAQAARDKRGARRRSENARIANAVQRRKKFEAKDAQPGSSGRMDTAQSFYPGAEKMSTGQIYQAQGWEEAPQSETHHPRMYDRQLPGMEDPYAAPTPPRWEDIEPARQASIARSVKMRTGADMDFMERSFGAQLDQAYFRAEQNGRVRPAGQDFYTNGEPRQVIKRSAEELGIPFAVHAAMNAFTSPQTKFRETSPSGQRRYPNNEAAVHVVRHMQDQESEWTIHAEANYTDPDTGRVKRHSGYPANFAKAGNAFKQFMAGKPMSAWRNHGTYNNPEGSEMFGPKTGPYHNSWLPSTPDYLVSDVHTGGGGFLPHLGTAKPYILDKETGEPKWNSTGSGFLTGKSVQEKAIETTGFHSMADHAARRALKARGLGSVRQAQAAQWNEQRIRRSETDKNLRNPLDSEERSYPPLPKRQEIPGQLGIQFR